MKTNVLVIFLTIASLGLASSCQSNKSDSKKVPAVRTESVEDVKIKDEIVKVVNSLPSNSETVNLINATGAAYLAGFTGEDLKTENLLTRADKAKAYGTVIFDLVYTHTYNQVESFNKLLKINETLTRDLGFEELITIQKQFRERYQNNKDNKDSVDFLVTDMVNKTNSFIQKNGTAVDISLVFAGAVVKSLNVISYLTMFAANKDKLMEILKNQKNVIHAACDILKKTTGDTEVNKLYEALVPINDLFNSSESFSPETVEKINKLTGFITE